MVVLVMLVSKEEFRRWKKESGGGVFGAGEQGRA